MIINGIDVCQEFFKLLTVKQQIPRIFVFPDMQETEDRRPMSPQKQC
jgi:hypothetical protein